MANKAYGTSKYTKFLIGLEDIIDEFTFICRKITNESFI